MGPRGWGSIDNAQYGDGSWDGVSDWPKIFEVGSFNKIIIQVNILALF